MSKNFTDRTANTQSTKMEDKKLECNDCMQNLQLLVDGEITKDQESHFRTHLDECTPCFSVYNVEKAVKEVLQKKLEKKHVPSSLINSIIDKIRLTV